MAPLGLHAGPAVYGCGKCTFFTVLIHSSSTSPSCSFASLELLLLGRLACTSVPVMPRPRIKCVETVVSAASCPHPPTQPPPTFNFSNLKIGYYTISNFLVQDNANVFKINANGPEPYRTVSKSSNKVGWLRPTVECRESCRLSCTISGQLNFTL